jgi:penicillin-binding protein 1A
MRGSFRKDLSEERARAAKAAKRRRKRGGRDAEAAQQRTGRALFWFLLRWFAVVLVWVGVLVAGMTAYLLKTLPDTDAWMRFDHRDSVSIRAGDGAVIATFGTVPGENLHLADLPKGLIDAVIATEDRRFYHHHGIDPVGLARAVRADLEAGAIVQGGSTITQQLAKNAFLTPDRTFLRKAQEVALALWLERHYTKDQILETYFNRVYFGASAYGVDAAARRYFGKSARRLDLPESAILAGLPRAPARYSPINDPAAARARARQVLANMVEAGFLSPAAAAQAAASLAHLPMAPVVRAGGRYFADWVQDQIAGAGYHGNLTVATTLDPRLQALAEAAVGRILARDGARLHVTEAALVAMTPDGAIKAMVGGRDYGASPFNRVTQAVRPPGSAFKLFVYLAALEQGYRPGDLFFDGPVSIHGWQPRDFEPGYRGDVTMSEAVAQSLNTVAAQVADKVGLDKVIDAARRLGITTPLEPDPSLALGTGGVTLLDLTSAYAVMDHGGATARAFGIETVRDSAGTLLVARRGDDEQVTDSDKAAAMTGMLEGVISHGTGRAAAIGRPAAGKTGTTSDFRDALFIGYTPDLVAGVWFGNDDDTPMRHVTGGSLPAEAWHDFMGAALRGTPSRPLEVYEALPGAVVSSQGGIARAWHHALHFLGLGDQAE